MLVSSSIFPFLTHFQVKKIEKLFHKIDKKVTKKVGVQKRLLEEVL